MPWLYTRVLWSRGQKEKIEIDNYGNIEVCGLERYPYKAVRYSHPP